MLKVWNGPSIGACWNKHVSKFFADATGSEVGVDKMVQFLHSRKGSDDTDLNGENLLAA